MEIFGIFITSFLAIIIAAGMIAASWLFGPKIKNPLKDSPFECGMPPAQKPVRYISNNFYKIALIFVIFDIETVFLYPWAVNFRQLTGPAFYSGLIFAAVFVLALFYIIKRGALQWD